jgi:hypothetical protein
VTRGEETGWTENQQLLTALTTEHFTLQGARASALAWIRYSDAVFNERAADVRPLFPSADAADV